MLKFPKKELYLVLSFMGKMSALVKSRLIRSLHKRLLFSKVKIVFKTSNRLKNYFSFKDVVPEPLGSFQIYNFTCGSRNASYIGKTFRHIKVRVSEHQGVLPRIGKHLKGNLSTSVRDHMLDCNHVVAWDEFKYWGESLIIGFWRLRRIYLLKEIDLRLTRTFTPRICFYLFHFNCFYYNVRYKILIAFICCYWMRCLLINQIVNQFLQTV